MQSEKAVVETIKLVADYHTHTVFSHGKGTIEENVKEAVAKGLKEIAITDHGFGSFAIGLKHEDIPVMRQEIDRLKKTYPIEIYLGVEANLYSFEGDLDVSLEETKLFDIIIFGAHQVAKPKNFKTLIGWWVRNLTKQTKKKIGENTKAYIEVIKRYKPKIIVHPNRGCKIDCGAVAKVAAEHGTLIELNGSCGSFTQKEIDDILAAGANFVIDSDAHEARNVGEFPAIKKLMQNVNIPLSRIVNIKH